MVMAYLGLNYEILFVLNWQGPRLFLGKSHAEISAKVDFLK